MYTSNCCSLDSHLKASTPNPSPDTPRSPTVGFSGEGAPPFQPPRPDAPASPSTSSPATNLLALFSVHSELDRVRGGPQSGLQASRSSFAHSRSVASLSPGIKGRILARWAGPSAICPRFLYDLCSFLRRTRQRGARPSHLLLLWRGAPQPPQASPGLTLRSVPFSAQTSTQRGPPCPPLRPSLTLRCLSHLPTTFLAMGPVCLPSPECKPLRPGPRLSRPSAGTRRLGCCRAPSGAWRICWAADFESSFPRSVVAAVRIAVFPTLWDGRL